MLILCENIICYIPYVEINVDYHITSTELKFDYACSYGIENISQFLFNELFAENPHYKIIDESIMCKPMKTRFLSLHCDP